MQINDDNLAMRENPAPANPTAETESRMQQLEIYKCYMDSKYLSLKVSSYFRTYDELLRKYQGRDIVFVEIGVLNGGSLFMWRNYLGPGAKVIGVDLNPAAKRWEAEGFEIHIGNQADPHFWDEFFATVGDVDIILDDGGHTNQQQIVTAHKSIPHIKDGGMLIVEDTHTSYFSAFGNPSKYSFMNYAKTLVDSINSRFPGVRASANDLNKSVVSISFYESIVCLKVDRTECFVSSVIFNQGISSNARDFREHDSHLMYISRFRSLLGKPFRSLRHLPFLTRLSSKVFGILTSLSSRLASRKLKKYF
jgi:hypothetical protein